MKITPTQIRQLSAEELIRRYGIRLEKKKETTL